MSCIRAENLSLAYDTGVVVEGLNFSIERGDYLCIIGENGSGKSTLIKCMLGLKKPRSGSLTFGEGLKPSEIGYLPQRSTAQRDFPASVSEVVLSGTLNSSRSFSPFYSAAQRNRAKDAMQTLGIDKLRNKGFSELSGGQQQRVLLARALCATKSLLLLDEPVAGLDPLVTHELYSIIERLNKDFGITIVMISHDIHSILFRASKILHLQQRQLFFGTSADYRSSAVGRHYLGGEFNV